MLTVCMGGFEEGDTSVLYRVVNERDEERGWYIAIC